MAQSVETQRPQTERIEETSSPAAIVPLADVLENTRRLASLAPEYLAGHAPGNQRKEGHPTPAEPDYYGLPAIKKPEWEWHIPAYFWIGGVASGAYITAALLDLRHRPEDASLVRAGRYVALAGAAVSPVLLIADLGRPERWYNMLRVFRPRSMMNMGAWGLALFGIFAAKAAGLQALQDLAPESRVTRWLTPAGRVVTTAGIAPAALVGTYTGLLLAATNVPLWAGSRLTIGPLFFCSAMSTGMAAVDLTSRMLGPVSEAAEERLKSAEGIALGAELAMTAGAAAELGRLAKPLAGGRWGRAIQLGSIGLGMVAPLVLREVGKHLSPRPRKALGLLASALVLAGGAVMRFAVTEAGKEQCDDPQAYFEYTRPKA